MPRRLPPLDADFSRQILKSLSLVIRIERQFLTQNNSLEKLQISDVELIYELAYLRVFTAWEVFLERVFLRMMCGYHHSDGIDSLRAAHTYERNIDSAQLALLSGRDYLLWHNVDFVIKRAKEKFVNSRYEIILASSHSRISYFATIRHRIAHDQPDSARKFDIASMSMAGKRYRASRPGRFLRDKKTISDLPTRWLEEICSELESLAAQICK
ncbi:MAG: hypothetical protein ACRC56_02120 [Bosea sp. (in: a-proteobacteria)]